MGKIGIILGISVLSFAMFVVIAIIYESSTGLNMLTGEKKTSGVGADKWEKTSSPKNSYTNEDEIYGIWDKMQRECDLNFGSPSYGFSSQQKQMAWNDCMNKANTWQLIQLDKLD